MYYFFLSCFRNQKRKKRRRDDKTREDSVTQFDLIEIGHINYLLLINMYGCCTICLLSLLLLVSCVDGKALDGKSNEHIPITSSILPLESCSSTSEIVRYRTSFMNEGHGCADEEFYLCGLDSTERYVIEVCHPDLECDPGKSI